MGGSFSFFCADANVAGTAWRQGVALRHVLLERIMMNGGGDDWQPPRIDRIQGSRVGGGARAGHGWLHFALLKVWPPAKWRLRIQRAYFEHQTTRSW